MTVMAWVYPETWSSIFPRIIHYHSANVKYVFGLVGDDSPTAPEIHTFWAGKDTLDANALTDVVSLNTWTHIAGVFDSVAGTWTLYKDGVSVPLVDADNIASNTEQMSIGVRIENTPLFHLNANLDEVRIISAARSDHWISAQAASMRDVFVMYGSGETF